MSTYLNILLLFYILVFVHVSHTNNINDGHKRDNKLRLS